MVVRIRGRLQGLREAPSGLQSEKQGPEVRWLDLDYRFPTPAHAAESTAMVQVHWAQEEGQAVVEIHSKPDQPFLVEDTAAAQSAADLVHANPAAARRSRGRYR